MKLHEKIFKYRKLRGLSQEALAEAVGVSRQAVSKWETGEAMPDVANLAALAKALGVSADTLLYDDGSEGTDQAPESDEAEETEESDETDSPKETAADKGMAILSAIPGFLGRILRKYGWITGLYFAISGFGFASVGLIARYALGSLFGFGVLPAMFSASGPMGIISNVIIAIGAVTMVGGIILAIWLKRRGGGRNT